MWTDGRTDRWTDGRTDKVITIGLPHLRWRGPKNIFLEDLKYHDSLTGTENTHVGTPVLCSHQHQRTTNRLNLRQKKLTDRQTPDEVIITN